MKALRYFKILKYNRLINFKNITAPTAMRHFRKVNFARWVTFEFFHITLFLNQIKLFRKRTYVSFYSTDEIKYLYFTFLEILGLNQFSNFISFLIKKKTLF